MVTGTMVAAIVITLVTMVVEEATGAVSVCPCSCAPCCLCLCSGVRLAHEQQPPVIREERKHSTNCHDACMS
jgi:hypothetical protein